MQSKHWMRYIIICWVRRSLLWRINRIYSCEWKFKSWIGFWSSSIMHFIISDRLSYRAILGYQIQHCLSCGPRRSFKSLIFWFCYPYHHVWFIVSAKCTSISLPSRRVDVITVIFTTTLTSHDLSMAAVEALTNHNAGITWVAVRGPAPLNTSLLTAKIAGALK